MMNADITFLLFRMYIVVCLTPFSRMREFGDCNQSQRHYHAKFAMFAMLEKTRSIMASGLGSLGVLSELERVTTNWHEESFLVFVGIRQSEDDSYAIRIGRGNLTLPLDVITYCA